MFLDTDLREKPRAERSEASGMLLCSLCGCFWRTLFTRARVKRPMVWCMPCVWLLTLSVPLHDVCGVCPNPWAGQHWCIWRLLERAPPTRYCKLTTPITEAKSIALSFILLFILLLWKLCNWFVVPQSNCEALKFSKMMRFFIFVLG